jgi:hypothetical protein
MSLVFDLPTIRPQDKRPVLDISHDRLFIYLVDKKIVTFSFAKDIKSVISDMNDAFSLLPEEIKNDFSSSKESIFLNC